MIQPSKLFLGEAFKDTPVQATVIIKSITGSMFSIDTIDCEGTNLECSYSSDNSDGIKLSVTGLITNQNMIDDNEIVIRLKMPDSIKPLIVKLPIAGLLRNSRRTTQRVDKG